VDEAVMVKLLDQYSERMLEMLDQKIEASIAAKKNGASEEVNADSGAEKEMESGFKTPENS